MYYCLRWDTHYSRKAHLWVCHILGWGAASLRRQPDVPERSQAERACPSCWPTRARNSSPRLAYACAALEAPWYSKMLWP